MTDKLIRTPREWDERCPKCRGTGQVHQRESFALWTPDEFQVGPIDPKFDVPLDAYVCTAVPGASIMQAVREGIAVVVCRPDNDPDKIAKGWWLRAYGETYEESLRKR